MEERVFGILTDLDRLINGLISPIVVDRLSAIILLESSIELKLKPNVSVPLGREGVCECVISIPVDCVPSTAVVFLLSDWGSSSTTVIAVSAIADL